MIQPVALQRRRLRLPGPDAQYLGATLYRIDDDRLRPLLLLNHGSPSDPARMREMLEPNQVAAGWFARLGWAVLAPLRRGFGTSDGPCIERPPTQRPATAEDYLMSARNSAKDVLAAARSMAEHDRNIDASQILAVGTSAGGLAAIALAEEAPERLSGIVSFAGGRGARADGTISGGIDALAEAFRVLGRRASVPQLWLYAANDQAFPPPLAQRLVHEYSTDAPVHPRLAILPPIQGKGHALIGNPLVWGPAVLDFLRELPALAQPLELRGLVGYPSVTCYPSFDRPGGRLPEP